MTVGMAHTTYNRLNHWGITLDHHSNDLGIGGQESPPHKVRQRQTQSVTVDTSLTSCHQHRHHRFIRKSQWQLDAFCDFPHTKMTTLEASKN